MSTLWCCKNCGELSTDLQGIELVKDPNPLPGTEPDEWCVCIICRSVDGFDELCDELGCRELAACGTPSAKGYRRTCGKHRPID